MRPWVLSLLAVSACGRLGFDFTSAGDDVVDPTGDGGTGTGDGGQGDGATPPDAFALTGCGSTVIIDDKFADGTKGAEWTSVNTSLYGVIEMSDILRIIFPGNALANTRAGYRQTASISFTGICAVAEITMVPNGSANSYAYLRLGTTTLNVEMAIENGQVLGRFTNGGTSGTNGSTAYSATAHRFLRIRESGGNYNFQVAGNFNGPYQTLGSAGGVIIQPSPSSVEIGGSTTATNATGAGEVNFERVLVLGP